MKKLLPATSRTFPNKKSPKRSVLEVILQGRTLKDSRNVSFLKIITFLVLLISLTVSPVQAQEITTTASPPRLELESLPGTNLQKNLKITNSSDTAQTYKITATDFTVNDSKGTPIPVLTNVSNRWSLASWLTTTPPTISIQPNQSSIITLQINIPQNALPGGHYAMVTYEPVNPNKIDSTGSAIASRVGTLIYLKVQGDITEAAYLKDLSVKKKWFEYGPIDINLEIENLGDIHLKPTGTFTITNLFNQPILEKKLEEVNIFPFASRTHKFQMPKKYYFGRFQAKLQANAGTSALPITGLIYFWVVPYKEISITLAAILIIIVLIILKKKKSKPIPPPETNIS
ncbi:MAG: Fn3-like domain-containing protein [Patescibacteria group bacterium]|nr:Fn3-like domain-containing protein [Patescibacteria group bacterium]